MFHICCGCCRLRGHKAEQSHTFFTSSFSYSWRMTKRKIDLCNSFLSFQFSHYCTTVWTEERVAYAASASFFLQDSVWGYKLQMISPREGKSQSHRLQTNRCDTSTTLEFVLLLVRDVSFLVYCVALAGEREGEAGVWHIATIYNRWMLKWETGDWNNLSTLPKDGWHGICYLGVQDNFGTIRIKIQELLGWWAGYSRN